MIRDVWQALKNYYVSPRRPLAAYLNLTERCNLRCIFCELGKNADFSLSEELSFDEVCRILNELKNWKVKKIFLGGGEPLIRQGIWSIFEYAASKKIAIWQVLTNGFILDGLTKEQKSILKRVVSILNISLDSASPELHDRLRGVPGTFARIKRFLELSANGGLPRVYITSIVARDNYAEIPRLTRFLGAYNIGHIGFQPINFFSNYPNRRPLHDKEKFLLNGGEDADRLLEAIADGIRISRELGISTNLELLKLFIAEYFLYAGTDEYFFDKVMNNFICSNVFNYLYIDSRGDLLACSLLPKLDNIAGKDLKDVWRRNAFNLRKWSRQKKFYPECRSCFCGFAANFSHCLIYHPIANFSLMRELAPYYLGRHCIQ